MNSRSWRNAGARAKAWLTAGALALVTTAAIALCAPPTQAAQAKARNLPPSIPSVLSLRDRQLYRRAFDALETGRITEARLLARQVKNPLLVNYINAEGLLADSQPAYEELAAWLSEYSNHPLAERLYRHALPLKPEYAELTPPAARSVPQSIEPASASWPDDVPPPAEVMSSRKLAQAVEPHLTADNPFKAEKVWSKRAYAKGMPAWARAKWARHIAWRYYLAGHNNAALRMATLAGNTASSEAGQAHWIAGLAAWRSGDCERASRHFSGMTQKPGLTPDLLAAGRFWEARAHFACGRPERVTPLLRQAADTANSFYGLLAQRTLGLEPRFNWGPPDFIQADWNQIKNIPAVQRAVALVRIGELGRADRELKHLWGLTDEANYDALVRLSHALGLPSAQKWLSARPPAGRTPPLSIRFPAPDWEPYGGWRIERALVYAIALKESNFQTDAVSRAGARGVMQLMPRTASALQDAQGLNGVKGSLHDPVFNLELGQLYLEKLRDKAVTGGLLPKVIASYNAGPTAVSSWNASMNVQGDPLLFIESIPYAQTRDYVERVLHYYWMYQLRLGEPTPSLDALARGEWPPLPSVAPGAPVQTVKRDSMIVLTQSPDQMQDSVQLTPQNDTMGNLGGMPTRTE